MILNKVDNYYTQKVLQHGTTPEGVDWNGYESQYKRFDQLLKIVTINSFSIADIGCGYGELAAYLEKNKFDFNYQGYDVSEKMIKQAQDFIK